MTSLGSAYNETLSEPTITVQCVSKWFGNVVAVNDVSLQVIGDTGRELVEEFSREVIAKY